MTAASPAAATRRARFERRGGLPMTAHPPTFVTCWCCGKKELQSLTLGWVRTKDQLWFCNPCAHEMDAEEGPL